MNEMPKPLQVYIVEDSPIIQRLLASAITAAGAEPVGFSADAQTAIADLFALQPDLILIDINLASGSGFDVLETLQEHSLVPEAVKVVLTNHANTEYENLSRQLGAVRFFDKSLETWEAVALIHGLAAKRRSGSAPPHHSSATHVAFQSLSPAVGQWRRWGDFGRDGLLMSYDPVQRGHVPPCGNALGLPPSDSTAGWLLDSDKPEDCQGARPHDPAVATGAG